MRSLLFVPGDSEKKLAKGLGSGADVLILDLEDSVGADRKEAARAITLAYLKATAPEPARPRLYVRINSFDTPYWQADLAGIVPGRPDGIMLPKPRSGEDVETLSITLGGLEEKAAIASGATRIIPIATELSASLLAMASYVGSSSRLEGLTWGAEDLSTEVGARTNRDAQGAFTSPFRLARDLTLFTAVAAGVAPIDTVFVNFRDTEGLRREAEAAARDGFTAKMAIHPDQVGPINEAFTPTGAELERARAIVALFAANPGAGVASLDGEMIDRPHLVKAERILARAGKRGP